MVTSVLVGYVKERERDGGRELLRAFLVFCRQAIPLEIYLGNVS